MATVALAEDTVLGRRVALKRMTTGGDERGLSRLRREALTGASLSHPNLVSVYDVLTSEEGDHVIVMEYVPGETLGDALSREGKLPTGAALRILDGVGAALDAIHRQGIVHRDVKPPNILLGTDGTVKLADLGIASVADRTRITSAGAVVGSFRYMAPEQLEDAPTTPAIDVYALSAVAFEVLSGRPARCESNPVALAHAISTLPPPDLREAWPQAPPAAAEVLIRGMARDPAQRPRSASELSWRLRAALEPEWTATVATAPVGKRGPAPGQRAGGVGAVAASEPVRPMRARGAAPRVATMPVNERRRPWRGLVAAGALALVAGLVALAVILSSGGGPGPVTRHSASATHRASSARTRTHATVSAAASATGATAANVTPATSTAASATTSTSAAPAASAPAAAAAPAASAPPASVSPVSAVESFYGLAASHRYSQAWALADPTFRNQLGGYQSFEAGQAGDHSISFDSAQPINRSGSGATVAVKTTSVRTDGTQHCTGTVELRPAGSAGTWLLHLIHINCS